MTALEVMLLAAAARPEDRNDAARTDAMLLTDPNKMQEVSCQDESKRRSKGQIHVIKQISSNKSLKKKPTLGEESSGTIITIIGLTRTST